MYSSHQHVQLHSSTARRRVAAIHSSDCGARLCVSAQQSGSLRICCGVQQLCSRCGVSDVDVLDALNCLFMSSCGDW
jgi:hypothetical protein